MDEIQVMPVTTPLSLHNNNREQVVVFEEGLCNANVARIHEGTGIMYDPEGLHVAGNGGCSKL